MDYKLKLMQILDCFGNREGTWHDTAWAIYGLSQEDQDQIYKDYEEYKEKHYAK